MGLQAVKTPTIQGCKEIVKFKTSPMLKQNAGLGLRMAIAQFYNFSKNSYKTDLFICSNKE